MITFQVSLALQDKVFYDIFSTCRTVIGEFFAALSDTVYWSASTATHYRLFLRLRLRLQSMSHVDVLNLHKSLISYHCYYFH